MRQHGRANISASQPRALGVCDRCGGLYNHHALRWQHDWRGPQIQNLRVLVCESCYDQPQPSGQRTIILPADPVPIINARPEHYVSADNPLSGLGYSPNTRSQTLGSRIGNMTDAGGLNAAFDSNANKPSFMSAMRTVSNSSYNNYVGINWSEAPASITPSSLNSPVLTHRVITWTITAPNDSTFGSTAFVIQASQTGGDVYGSWTTIYSGSPTGDIGEELSGTGGGPRAQFHRVAFLGDGVNAVAVAQVEFNVAEGSSQNVGI